MAVPWAFYSWNVSLTGEGLQLAARNLLELLRTFRSRQLVTFGLTAIPLMSGCVALGNGEFTGACIREKRKTYLSGRRIEGPLDKRQPVVVVDDSLSSGRSLGEAIKALEMEGVTVEGAVALVNFPHRGGLEWATEVGYRVETLFDIWRDLKMPRPRAAAAFRDVRVQKVSRHRAPEGLHPATLARRVAGHYLRTGEMLRPPTRMDRAYDGRGGVFVSFRDRTTDFRLARDGFWHLRSRDASAARDVVLATIETLNNAKDISAAMLRHLKIAVSFLSPLERIAPGELNFDRYGIVVQSQLFPRQMGGALPNTQVFSSEIEQYEHARYRNAGLGTGEPHHLYRHEVKKFAEPGETWLSYGALDPSTLAWAHDLQVGEALVRKAREALGVAPAGASPHRMIGGLIRTPVLGVAVNLYHRGEVISKMAWGNRVGRCVIRAARDVGRQRSARKWLKAGAGRTALAVYVLFEKETLNGQPMQAVCNKVRRGLNAFSCGAGSRRRVILPAALSYNNLTKEEFVAAAMGGAPPRRAPVCALYRTAGWVDHRGAVRELSAGFPVRQADAAYGAAECERDIRSLAGYVMRNLGRDGLPAYCGDPLSGRHVYRGTAARVLHALAGLAQAGRLLEEHRWIAAAQTGLRNCLRFVGAEREGELSLPHHAGDALADCVFLAALCACGADVARGKAVRSVARRVAALFQDDGRIVDAPTTLIAPADGDYLPGAAIWAMASYLRLLRDPGVARRLGARLERTSAQLAWNRRRFSVLHSWGAAGWQAQGWGEAHVLSKSTAHAQFVFEIADWAIEHQLRKNGAFLEDLSEDEPSFNTAFIAEGMAAAWSVALRSGERARAVRYEHSWQGAAQFFMRLSIRPEDTFWMNRAEAFVGSVRTSASRSSVRIDQVSHCLGALCRGLANLRNQPVGF